MQLPELWLPRDTMSPLSFLSLDTGRWICAINSLFSKILEIIQGLHYSGDQKNLNNMEHNIEQRCRGGSAEGEHRPGNISSLFLLFLLAPALPSSPKLCESTGPSQCHRTALLPGHKAVWHRGTGVAVE